MKGKNSGHKPMHKMPNGMLMKGAKHPMKGMPKMTPAQKKKMGSR